jgi:glucosamine-6-phosphate deaminase
VELAESTRRDNLATFPSFGSLDRVPRFGVTVGLGTIVRHSSRVTLLLSGAEKQVAFSRTVAATAFDPEWPATIVHECRSARIVADRAAAARS